MPLPIEFYLQPTLNVAEALIGQVVVRKDRGQILSGRIVETEAYLVDDASNHAARGMTPRNSAMYGRAGCAYVYLIYGMHYCLNLVTAPEGVAEAVLVRAVEPVEGLEGMRERRPCGRDQLLTSGPARLCQAFGIDLSLNKTDAVAGDLLWVDEGPGPRGHVQTRTRIGISNAVAAAYAWRFVEAGNPYLSRR